MARYTELRMKHNREMKQASEDLELLFHAIVRNVSHELVTPTQQAKAALALLREEREESEVLHWAKQAIQRLEQVIEHITSLMDPHTFHPEATLLREMVHYALLSLEPNWGEATLRERVKVELPLDTPAVYADKQGVKTVLRILVDNALKFSEGPVQIRAESLENAVAVSIIDGGIGLDVKRIPAIFAPFTQMDDSTTRPYGGIGVGLAIAQKILENHGSQLQVESEKEKGSRFSFLLPVQ